jgi:hypothetical protein
MDMEKDKAPVSAHGHGGVAHAAPHLQLKHACHCEIVDLLAYNARLQDALLK